MNLDSFNFILQKIKPFLPNKKKSRDTISAKHRLLMTLQWFCILHINSRFITLLQVFIIDLLTNKRRKFVRIIIVIWHYIDLWIINNFFFYKRRSNFETNITNLLAFEIFSAAQVTQVQLIYTCRERNLYVFVRCLSKHIFHHHFLKIWKHIFKHKKYDITQIPVKNGDQLFPELISSKNSFLIQNHPITRITTYVIMLWNISKIMYKSGTSTLHN